ncbi:MAG TPA: A24 family peptidase [Streptosporangiaceae bacterium]|nr:A24 family peptidase [Streptosporangiaceae bacterium]
MHMPGWVLVVAAAAAGMAVGSYLAVLAAAVPAGAGLFRAPSRLLSAPSRCPECGARGRAAAAIPLVGWLPRGRCRGCGTPAGAAAGPPASTWRPAVELGTGALFAVMALRFGFSPVLPAFWFLAALAVVLAVIDLQHRRLPDPLTLPAYPVAVVLLGVAALAISGGARHLVSALAGMAAAWLFFLLLALVYPAGLGWGDVKLSGVLGLYLGWLGATALLAGVLGAFVLASLAGLALIAAGRATRKSHIPFGPFMLASAIVVIACSGLVPALAR